MLCGSVTNALAYSTLCHSILYYTKLHQTSHYIMPSYPTIYNTMLYYTYYSVYLRSDCFDEVYDGQHESTSSNRLLLIS